ncbi:MAG: hypothetical protein P4K92_02290 [Candidatus Nitrosotalea sp.]|nr:hypothetical protein [Candidatus Nitrosotalea sp.]
MPLSERTLVLLNPLKSIDDNKIIGREQVDLIRDIFKKILSSGDSYKIHEIENWLDNGQKINPSIAERILNVAHYQKAKFDANNPLKMADDSCGCGGDC